MADEPEWVDEEEMTNHIGLLKTYPGRQLVVGRELSIRQASIRQTQLRRQSTRDGHIHTTSRCSEGHLLKFDVLAWWEPIK